MLAEFAVGHAAAGLDKLQSYRVDHLAHADRAARLGRQVGRAQRGVADRAAGEVEAPGEELPVDVRRQRRGFGARVVGASAWPKSSEAERRVLGSESEAGSGCERTAAETATAPDDDGAPAETCVRVAE